REKTDKPRFTGHAHAAFRFTQNFPRTALRSTGRRCRQADEGQRKRLKTKLEAPIPPCTKTAHDCGNPPRIRPAVFMRARDNSGMQQRSTHRWSLPCRLRSESWWLVDPPRPEARPRTEASLLPFIRPPAGQIQPIRKVLA
ncbi:hypothetical protein, partial [Mesorhizobium caraganae]|uniref:hypothetical protein n=1 Tax=Mesorhizobium caraganae TaxID=483206 RepID=UPI00333AA364